MKAIIARIINVLVVILQYRSLDAKRNNELFLSRYRQKRSAALQRNWNNEFVHQFEHNRSRTLLNRYDFLAIFEPGRKHSIDKRQPAKFMFTKIQNKATYRRLQDTHKSLPPQHHDNEAFFRMFNEPMQNKFNKRPEMNENFATTYGVKRQSNTTFHLSSTLNVLRQALLVHPFNMWKLKHKFSSIKDIRVHENTLHDVIRNRQNEKLKRKLYKVLQGEDVYLDLLGGSNSAGGGLKKDEGDVEGRYSKVITHWWNKTITPITGSKLKLREIAMGGTSSEFFQFCFASYIHEKLDLVFIEMAVNDMRDLPSNANKSLPLEQLTRQLLVYPTEPALVYINLFPGRQCNGGCTNLEDYGQDFLTRTYNITSLKWRDAVCFRNAENNHLKSPCDLIASDGNHINQLGHAHISLMIINLFRKILLDHIFSAVTNSGVSGQKNLTLIDPQFLSKIPRKQIALPRPVLIKKTTNTISKPLCWTNLSPNYHRLDDIKNNLDVIIAKTKDFFLETSKIGEKCTKPPCRMDSVSSWTGKTVGANITFSFTIPSGSSSLSARAIQTRSVAIGIRTCWDCGGANMWLDDDYKNKKFFSTRLHYGQTRARMLAFHVKPGNHSLGIEVAREGKVSIVAIMVGPPDGPY